MKTKRMYGYVMCLETGSNLKINERALKMCSVNEINVKCLVDFTKIINVQSLWM
jgi:hypothetical protein